LNSQFNGRSFYEVCKTTYKDGSYINGSIQSHRKESRVREHPEYLHNHEQDYENVPQANEDTEMPQAEQKITNFVPCTEK